MSRSILTFVKSAVGALVLCAFTSTSFAAVDMFLEIKDLKGKVVSRCEVSKDGSFDCPALPAGEYTASLEWSWGESNASSTGTGHGTGKVSVNDLHFRQSPSAITFHYTVKSPRDAASGQASGKRDHASGQASGKRDHASGQASGKRQHKPVTFVKEIDKSSPMLMKTMDKSTPKLMLATFTVDDDCDGIVGKISATNSKKEHIEIYSWSWGESNHGSSR